MKVWKLLALIGFVLNTAGCDVKVPKVDKVAPDIELMVVQDGNPIGKVTATDKPLTLRGTPGTKYVILATGKDTGGVASTEVRIARTWVSNGNLLTQGNQNQPKDKLFVTISLKPMKQGQYVQMVAVAKDFHANAAATPKLTIAVPPVKPSVTLTASSTTIADGESTTLTWDSKNATQLIIQPSLGSVSVPSGSKVVRPTSTTKFVLSGISPTQDKISAPLTITVKPRIQCNLKRTGDQLVTLTNVATGRIVTSFDYSLPRTRTPEFVGNVATTPDGTRGVAAILTRILKPDGTLEKEDFRIDMFNLEGCNQCGNVPFTLDDGSKGSMGIITLTKTNMALVQYVIGKMTSQGARQQHGFGIIDLTACNSLGSIDYRYYLAASGGQSIPVGDLIVTPNKTAFFLNAAHTIAGVIVMKDNPRGTLEDFFVSVVDLRQGREKSRPLIGHFLGGNAGKDGIARARVNNRDELVIRGKGTGGRMLREARVLLK